MIETFSRDGRRIAVKRILLLCLLVVLLPARLPAWGQAPLALGAALPDFNETSVSGKPINARSLQGKPLLVWFTNFSEGSISATPEFIEVCRKHPELTFVVMSLNGPSDARAREFAGRFDLPDNVAIDADGSTVRVFTGAFVQGGVPLYNLFAFGRNGRLSGRWHFPGCPPDKLGSELQRL
jgi:hypothetical protein